MQVKLAGWMKQNNSKHWAIGAKFCQWRYNTQIHLMIKDTPYHLTYEQHPRVGLSWLPVDDNVLQRLVTESDQNDLYAGMQASMFVGPSDPSEICEELANTVADMSSALSENDADEMSSPENSTLPAKRSGGRPSNEGTRKKARVRSGVLATALVAGLMSPPTGGICPEIIGKSAGTKDATTPWVNLLEGVHIWDAKEFLTGKNWYLPINRALGQQP